MVRPSPTCLVGMRYKSLVSRQTGGGVTGRSSRIEQSRQMSREELQDLEI